MNYENVVLIFKNRFPTGNTYSFISVIPDYKRKSEIPITSHFFIDGAPYYLDIIAYDITKRGYGSKTDWIENEVDGERTLFNKSWLYLYRLDDGRYGTINFATGQIRAFDNDNAEANIHRFFFSSMTL